MSPGRLICRNPTAEAHDTHLIESINGIQNWWYVAYYDGGWPERNVWRLDLYTYKDGTVFQLSQVSDTPFCSFYIVLLRKKFCAGQTTLAQ